MSDKTIDTKLLDSNNGKANKENSDNRKSIEVNVMSSVNDTGNPSSVPDSDDNYHEDSILIIQESLTKIMKLAGEDSKDDLIIHEGMLMQLLIIDSPCQERVALHLLELNRSGMNRLQILMRVLNKEPYFTLFLNIVDALCYSDEGLQLLSYDIKTVETILNYLSSKNVPILIKVINFLQYIVKHSFRPNFSSDWIHRFQNYIHFERDIISILTCQNNGQVLKGATKLLLSLSTSSVSHHDLKENVLAKLFLYSKLVPALTLSYMGVISSLRTHLLEEFKESEFFDYICDWLTLINNIIKDGDFSFHKCGGVDEYRKIMIVIRHTLEEYQWPDISAHTKVEQYARMIRACMNLLHDLHVPGCFVPSVVDSSLMNIMHRLHTNLNSEKEEIHLEEYNVLLSDMRTYWFYIIGSSKNEQLFEVLHHCKSEVIKYLMYIVQYANSVYCN